MMRRAAQIAAAVLLTVSAVACTHAGSIKVKPVARGSSASPIGLPASPTGHPSPSTSARVVGAAVADVTFVSAVHGWALTSGALYETTDRGRRWRRAELPVSSITHVRFVNATVGYAWNATGRLWLTSDDGRSWRRGGLSEVDSLEASPSGVWAIAGPQPYANVWRSDVAATRWTKLAMTPNRGGELLPHGDVTYVLGEQGAGPVVPSFDVYVAGRRAGNELLPCEHPRRLVPTSPMAVSTDGSLFLVCDIEQAGGGTGHQLAYTSLDHGRTWFVTTPPPKPVSGVAAARGARLAWDLDLWTYRDGRWQPSLAGPASSDLGGFKLVGFQDDSHAVALTNTGQLFLTSDDGRTWRLAPLPTRAPATDCRASELRVQGGRQGGGGFGSASVEIQIVNVGTQSCALPSPSALAIVDTRGERLPIEVLSLAAAAGASAVALAPRGQATLTLSWQNWCGRRSGSLRVQVTFAADGTATGSFDGPPDYNFWPNCITRSKYSILQVLGPYTLT